MEYIFSDFDGTVTKEDIIHKFITSFSKGDYTIAEGEWVRGEISSKECFNRQFKMIDGLDKDRFYNFIESIEIDPYFVEFYKYAVNNNKKLVIVSDGFNAFIEPVLKKHNINIPIFSNKLYTEEKDGQLYFRLEYPNIKKDCKIGLGVCKCDVAKSFTNKFAYIGDGLSDRCISKNAEIVFAKKSLEKFCIKNGMPYVHFETFKEVLDYFSLKLIQA